MWKPVIVVDYNLSWAATFEVLREQVASVLGETASAIEHVGSTAVPGLAAKHIIDIDVLLAAEAMLPEAIERLARLGYVHQGDLGISEREAFLTPAGAPAHHLYVCPPHSREFQRHVAFRDYLRVHPAEAKAYGDLKKTLAMQFRDDRDAYMAGKDELVKEILAHAMMVR
jgi:GrpB-like predicted nucleotidyltransferase (UPF0157 family)